MPATIVLVHGAFAESASWDRAIDPLLDAGHRVISAANPLRSLATDGESVSDLVRSVNGPVVLVGHSYGGAVISNVDADAGDIVGLVYVNGFAPGPGESCFQLAAMFPGSRLSEQTARPVSRSDGTTDLSIKIIDRLGERGHDAVAADPRPSVHTLTGEELVEAVAGAAVVIDVSTSPSFEDGPSWPSSRPRRAHPAGSVDRPRAAVADRARCICSPVGGSCRSLVSRSMPPSMRGRSMPSSLQRRALMLHGSSTFSPEVPVKAGPRVRVAA